MVDLLVRYARIVLFGWLGTMGSVGTASAADSTSVQSTLVEGQEMLPNTADRSVGTSSGEPSHNLQKIRLAFWGGLSLTEGIIAYQQTAKIWGKPKGKFHFKNDLHGDRMALTDEISHMFIGYKMAQIMRLGYQWSGLSPRAAARAGAIQAALYMGFVEFPMDAYNPRQGFGISDLIADLAGVGLAWYRAGRANPRWDIKASVKSQFFEGNNRLLAHTDKQYDDYIYWLTYRVSENRYNPIVLGLGYSTHHPDGRTVDKEVHFRIGTSFSEIGRIFGRRTEQLLSPAEFYFLSVGPRTHWK